LVPNKNLPEMKKLTKRDNRVVREILSEYALGIKSVKDLFKMKQEILLLEKKLYGFLQNKIKRIVTQRDKINLELARDIEIVVIDGIRRHGNKRCLPAGPLRESIRRLKSVDMIVSNGLPGKGEHQMSYITKPLRLLIDNNQQCEISALKTDKIHAIAGTGHPERFFSLLKKQGLEIIEHIFPDHYLYTKSDIEFDDGLSVIMTEKDAVKCMQFAEKYHWYLPIDVEMSNTFVHRLSILLMELQNGQEAA